MQLDEWMSINGLSDGAMANLVRADRATINRVRRGITRPSWQLAARIKAATKGAVSADTFLPPRRTQPLRRPRRNGG
jgi:predicted transcriptional regulator